MQYGQGRERNQSLRWVFVLLFRDPLYKRGQQSNVDRHNDRRDHPMESLPRARIRHFTHGPNAD